jgi:hypothetical protein
MSLASVHRGKTEVVQELNQVGDIEALRQILIEQKHTDVSHDEAKEVGAALIEFYEILAAEADDECTD